MNRIFLSLIFLAVSALIPAHAQVTIGGSPSITFNKCAAGSFLDGSFSGTTALTANCVAAPAGGGGTVTLTQSGCVSVTGASPNYTIGTVSTAVSKPSSFAVATTDNCKWFIYTGTAAGTATIPATTGLSNGFGFVIEVPASSAPLTLAFGSASHGGPSVLSPGQSAAIQVDDQGKWAMFAGVSQAVPNPNPFH
jgi:hypothetical protein